MNISFISVIVTTLLLLGSGYTVSQFFFVIEKLTLTRVEKGLSSSEEFAQQLTGERLDSSERLVPAGRNRNKY